MKNWKYIYGPVFSWRLGHSLGIDLLSQKKKVCSFDCVYCQLGRTLGYTTERKIFVPTNEIVKELELFPKIKIDYITFSGIGEPTLAKNLGEVITAVKRLRKEPIAVLTNSLLIHRNDVRKELMPADFVAAKLDSFSEESFRLINRPAPGISFEDMLEGIKRFKQDYKKRFAIQIMFIEENKNDAAKLAGICQEIQPDEVHINTPLRPCPVKALSEGTLSGIKKHFKGMKTISVYDVKPKKTVSISAKDTLKRRGKP